MELENVKIEEQFINIMFNLKNESEVNDNYETLIKVLHRMENNHTLSPYDYITQYIFEHDDIENPDEAVMTFSALKDMYRERAQDNSDFIDDLLGSIERHIRLAIIQQRYIQEQTKKVTGLNQRISAELIETKDEMIHLQEEMRNVKVDKASVYTDFIAIMGIFSALLFGLFVGFDVFKELVATMTTTAKLSRSIIMGSLLLIGLVSLIFLLFEGIARLTDRNMKSCCNELVCQHNIYQRYPVFFCSLLVLVSIVLLSTIILLLNMQGYLYHSTIFLVVIIILTIMLWVAAWKMMIKPKKHIEN